jgi:hypothetical protein
MARYLMIQHFIHDAIVLVQLMMGRTSFLEFSNKAVSSRLRDVVILHSLSD